MVNLQKLTSSSHLHHFGQQQALHLHHHQIQYLIERKRCPKYFIRINWTNIYIKNISTIIILTFKLFYTQSFLTWASFSLRCETTKLWALFSHFNRSSRRRHWTSMSRSGRRSDKSTFLIRKSNNNIEKHSKLQFNTIVSLSNCRYLMSL